jgi:hypothetical protein
MRYWKEVVTAGGALMFLVTPLWAHPLRAIHIHTGEVVPLLAVAAGMAVLLVRRRFRAHPSREG